jgi:hypothetical protein
MISFLKKEDDQKGGFMGKGDIIFLLVVGAVVGGFFYYTKSIKAESAKQFAECQKIWDSGDLISSQACYDKARNLQYVTDSLDSIVYLRLDSIQQVEEDENNFFAKVDSAIVRKDSAAVMANVKALPKFVFLDSAKVEILKSWNALANAPVVDTTGKAQAK